ncbi:MAG: transposase, partial [Porticoccaceae bacterium]|nr:transposase [Porticoccaceae bacterium]
MTRARSQQVSLEATPYYHCVSRCVRRAFLCGESFEHRRGWVEDKLLALAQVFCIDVAAYAVMSNHYHVVLHINAPQAEQLTDLAVIERWHQLFKGNLLSQRYSRGEQLLKAEQAALDRVIKEWRQRLQDISWFMRLINEGIARQANKEDQCTGRFWEGRFKSQ